jgi:YegS/Rv2252/BmrU family lipid kinase
MAEKVHYTRVLFVINPKSGSRKEKDLTHLIASQAKKSRFNFKLYPMKGDDEANIRQEIEQFQPEVIAAAGGDGTINFLAGILKGTEISLLIVPFGSANGMAKELGIGNSIELAISLLENGVEKPIDLLTINGKTCIHLADVGLNARIVKRFEADPNRGVRTYAKHLLAEMFLLKTYRFRIICDDSEFIRKAVSLTFANASKYGTGAVINPEGIIDDGKLELVIIKPFPRIKLLSIAWKMFMNTLHTSDYVEIVKCSKAKVISRRKTTLQIDGEVIGKVQEIDVEILPKALKVLVPGNV